MSKIFVYGTLQRGLSNNRIIASGKFIGTAKVKGFALYDVASFPGIVPAKIALSGKPSVVLGELWEVDPETEQACDRLEGVRGTTGMYLKKKTRVVLDSTGETIEAYIYVWNSNHGISSKTYREDCQTTAWRGAASRSLYTNAHNDEEQEDDEYDYEDDDDYEDDNFDDEYNDEYEDYEDDGDIYNMYYSEYEEDLSDLDETLEQWWNKQYAEIFPNHEIKLGMIVETRNGKKHLVFGNKLLSSNNFLWLNHNKNLKDLRRSSGDTRTQWDIVRGFKLKNTPETLPYVLNLSCQNGAKELKKLITNPQLFDNSNLELVFEIDEYEYSYRMDWVDGDNLTSYRGTGENREQYWNPKYAEHFKDFEIRLGMVVQTRNEKKYLVFGNKLLASSGFRWFSQFSHNADLTACADPRLPGKDCSEEDIIKGFRFKNIPQPVLSALKGKRLRDDKELEDLIEFLLFIESDHSLFDDNNLELVFDTTNQFKKVKSNSSEEYWNKIYSERYPNYEIKFGMVLQTRNGQRHITLGEKLWSIDGFVWFKHNENLKYDNSCDWDIVKGFKIKDVPLKLKPYLNGTNENINSFKKILGITVKHGLLCDPNLELVFETNCPWKCKTCGCETILGEVENGVSTIKVFKGDRHLGTIYPYRKPELDRYIYKLNKGGCPICDCWEDGKGNNCADWSEDLNSSATVSKSRLRKAENKALADAAKSAFGTMASGISKALKANQSPPAEYETKKVRRKAHDRTVGDKTVHVSATTTTVKTRK